MQRVETGNVKKKNPCRESEAWEGEEKEPMQGGGEGEEKKTHAERVEHMKVRRKNPCRESKAWYRMMIKNPCRESGEWECEEKEPMQRENPGKQNNFCEYLLEIATNSDKFYGVPLDVH